MGDEKKKTPRWEWWKPVEDDDDEDYEPPEKSTFQKGFEGAMGGCLGVLLFIVILVSALAFLLGR